MVKKTTTTRTARPSQQRSKEDQWRRRMAAQATTGTIAEPASADEIPVEANSTQAKAASSRPRTAATSTGGSRAVGGQASAASQRSVTRGAVRTRLSANTLSIDEEMQYVRGDIRKLVIMTAVCIAVIIALSFLLPYIIQ